MINPTDGSSLLGRAGFTTTTVDVEDLTINYPSMWDLISDLRDMGESNAILGRRANVSRDVLVAADAIYNGASFWSLSPKESSDRRCSAVLGLGWRPDDQTWYFVGHRSSNFSGDILC